MLTFTVSMTDEPYQFQPMAFTIPAGTTVTWTNTSPDEHTVTDDPGKALHGADAAFPAGTQPWDSGPLYASQRFSHTFATPGTYSYFCTVYEAVGMLGTITVT